MKVSEFKTGRFYIDTNFFYHFLRPEPKYKPLTDRLFQRIEDGEVRAFTTVLVFDELAYRPQAKRRVEDLDLHQDHKL